jgi:hypothetical protein
VYSLEAAVNRGGCTAKIFVKFQGYDTSMTLVTETGHTGVTALTYKPVIDGELVASLHHLLDMSHASG